MYNIIIHDVLYTFHINIYIKGSQHTSVHTYNLYISTEGVGLKYKIYNLFKDDR